MCHSSRTWRTGAQARPTDAFPWSAQVVAVRGWSWNWTGNEIQPCTESCVRPPLPMILSIHLPRHRRTAAECHMRCCSDYFGIVTRLFLHGEPAVPIFGACTCVCLSRPRILSLCDATAVPCFERAQVCVCVHVAVGSRILVLDQPMNGNVSVRLGLLKLVPARSQ